MNRKLNRKLNRKHWADMGEHSFVAGIWFLYWIHRLTGRWVFRVCMAPAVLIHWLARPALRHASLQYLQRLHAAQPGVNRQTREQRRQRQPVGNDTSAQVRERSDACNRQRNQRRPSHR